jgi:hypothetical protein
MEDGGRGAIPRRRRAAPPAPAVSAGEYAGVEAVATGGTPPASYSPAPPPPPPAPVVEVVAAAAAAAPPSPPQPPPTADQIKITHIGRNDAQQQEIDVLRGRVDLLSVEGVWTAVNPPLFAGTYGRLLQDLEAGVQLRDSFATLNHTAASVRDSAQKVYNLIDDHTTMTFGKRKG